MRRLIWQRLTLQSSHEQSCQYDRHGCTQKSSTSVKQPFALGPIIGVQNIVDLWYERGARE